MRRTTRRIVPAIFATALVAGCGSDGTEPTSASGDTEGGAPHQRLVITESDSPVVHILDLETGEPVAELELDDVVDMRGAAFTSDGRYFLAPHSESVTIIDGGVWSEPHGDHDDHHVVDPSVVGSVLGPLPTHLVSADGVTALYFDGAGEAIIVDEASFAAGSVEEIATVTTTEPHHGFAVPVGEGYMITVPSADMDLMPNLVGVADQSGALYMEETCTETHGETTITGGAAAACKEGVLVFTGDREPWDSTLIPYPEVDDHDPYGFGEPRSWILHTPNTVEWIVAPMGTNHVLRVDPMAGQAAAFDMDERVALFGTDVDAEGRIVVLTTDGTVHLVNADTGTTEQSATVIDAFAEDDPGTPYPRLIVTGDHAYLSDPATSTILGISLDDLSVATTIELSITPGVFGIFNG
jgi:hypothetical protein